MTKTRTKQMSVSQAAAVLDVSRQYVHRMIGNSIINPDAVDRLGDFYIINASEVERLLDYKVRYGTFNPKL